MSVWRRLPQACADVTVDAVSAPCGAGGVIAGPKFAEDVSRVFVADLRHHQAVEALSLAAGAAAPYLIRKRLISDRRLKSPSRSAAALRRSTRYCGRPAKSRMVVWLGSTIEPGQHFAEVAGAIRHLAAQGLVAPITWPIRMPPPASRAPPTCDQWSRPASLLITGRPTELTPGDDGHIVAEAALVQVFHQGAQSLIVSGDQELGHFGDEEKATL